MWSRRSLPLFVSALLCAGRGEERDQVESPSVPPPFGGGRVPVVVDTDIGQDVDDSWALSYLFALQDVFELSLVVTSSRCTTGKALLTERFIERSLNRKGTEEEGTGERGIPVVSGQATSPPLDFEQYGGPCCNGTLTCETDTLEACRSGFFVGPLWGWMEGEGEGEGGVASEDFVSAMLRAFDQGTRLVLALGPLTNLAAFQERHPETARQMTVVIMGGSIYTGYGGGPPSAEYNIRSDVQSAQRVFTEGGWKEILLAPLDSTQDIVLEGDLYGVLRETASAGTSAIASTLMEHYDYWFSRGCARVPKWCPGRDAEGSPFSPELKSSRLFDVGAVELLLAFVESRVESTFRIETIRVEVSEEGLTRVVETGGQEEGGKEGGDETQEEEEDKSNNSPSAARFPWSVGPKGRRQWQKRGRGSPWMWPLRRVAAASLRGGRFNLAEEIEHEGYSKRGGQSGLVGGRSQSGHFHSGSVELVEADSEVVSLIGDVHNVNMQREGLPVVHKDGRAGSVFSNARFLSSVSSDTSGKTPGVWLTAALSWADGREAEFYRRLTEALTTPSVA